MRTAQCPLCGKPQPVRDPLRAQAATPRRLLTLTRGLSRTQLLARPAPGKWSIHEIVCHLADTELANAWRYRQVLAEDEVGLTAWDQDRWAAGHQYRRQDLTLALAQFRVLRARNLALLLVVGRKAWKRTARHATLGALSAGQIAAHLVHHDANHVAQIERIRAAFKGREKKTGGRSVRRPRASRERQGSP